MVELQQTDHLVGLLGVMEQVKLRFIPVLLQMQQLIRDIRVVLPNQPIKVQVVVEQVVLVEMVLVDK